MIGVHGNGLTSLLWMQPGPSATVIEIFQPTGISLDYQVAAQVIGIEHYGVWKDRYARRAASFVVSSDTRRLSNFRSNSGQKPARHRPKGFHGNQIPVHGLTVAALCIERITAPTRMSSKMRASGASARM